MKDTIIMLDDNEDILISYSALLKRQGYKVLAFSKVGAATKYILENDVSNVHSIISDVMMGPIDGLDFLSFVKSNPKLKGINLFIMSGASDAVLNKLYRDTSIKKIMHKPFAPSALIDAITEDETLYKYKD